MSDYNTARDHNNEVNSWYGTFRVEDGVLYIMNENVYQRTKSSPRLLIILTLSVLSFLYGVYLLYTGGEPIGNPNSLLSDSEAVRVMVITGICGFIIFLMNMYDNYIWGSLPLSPVSKEKSIPINCIQEVSTESRIKRYTPHKMVIEYTEDEVTKKRTATFMRNSNMLSVKELIEYHRS
jgi:hypothetical protein